MQLYNYKIYLQIEKGRQWGTEPQLRVRTGLQGELPSPTVYCQLLQTGRCCLLYPGGGRKLLFHRKTAQPIRDCRSPNNEKPSYSELPGFSRELWLLQLLPTPPLYPIKASSPFLFFGFAYPLPWVSYPKVQFLWLFPNKLAFAGKIIVYYIIKVDNKIVKIMGYFLKY